MDKAAFKRRFLKLFSPRLHMSLIMLATILSGLVFSKLLLWIGLANMALRYPLVLVAAYGCFFLLLRLYLIYLTQPFADGAAGKSTGSSIDVVSVGSGSGGGSSGGSGESFFKGGSTGGGGVSGSWGADDVDPAPVAAVVSGTSQGAGESSSGLLGGAGDAVGDSDGWVLIVIGLVVVAIFGSSIVLIYQAPAILSEAAFQLLLAGGLAKTTRQAATADWMGSVFKATWKPFALVLVLTAVLGVMLRHYCPQAGKIADAFRMCL